ncbi:hypothetical protein DO021_13365 [Desulfobacter hydrogenophilus]|uniref:Uncharacterized protein n=1 Tax=Desulfobacter hydrogenophilus TaxID=2291 RepID=A0A328FDG7_9BACT|nr:hypothetical protein [Desulfobacter hydrogenophilus]NDY72939.1 hypothetical protein [Desulfobacter hydrogenophilus]QBH12441.1 hypothetical protein EYB58_05665 [Desulfobacter hydrogenophilus]RAM01472.1 hypothetical protein DO021_13365 [Desulfobacter hydrogenophilus]
MEPTATWTSIEIVTVATSIATPLIITVLGFIFTLAIRRIEWAKESEREDEQKKKKLAEEERKLAPHIELNVGCRFMGPSQGRFLAEFSLMTHNKGTHVHRFPKIIFRVRGIKFGQELKYWEQNEHRVNFPDKLLETDLVPKQWNFIFVQPNIKQRITFVTYIDQGYQFVIANAEFHYDGWTPHTVEKAFEMPKIEKLCSLS